MIIWEPNKAIDVGECSISGGGRLERFYGICSDDVRDNLLCVCVMYVYYIWIVITVIK